MTTENVHTKLQEELELFVLELSEVKGVLRELSQQLLRIERRVKAALPPSTRLMPTPRKRQRMDGSAARRTIEQLTERAKNGEQIESELRQMTVKSELGILARELGMTNTKLPPKDILVGRISTRLRQGAFVVSGIQDEAR